MMLLQRILREKRPIIVPLAIALLANIAAYVLVVRPLGVRSANAADRARAAARPKRPDRTRRARWWPARRWPSRNWRRSMTKCSCPTVLGATETTLPPALARRRTSGYDASHTAIEAVKISGSAAAHQHGARGRLRQRQAVHLRARMTPGFVIIDDVTLGQSDPERPRAVAELSAHYRTGLNGNDGSARWSCRAPVVLAIVLPCRRPRSVGDVLGPANVQRPSEDAARRRSAGSRNRR
jgi:hypothetical protein